MDNSELHVVVQDFAKDFLAVLHIVLDGLLLQLVVFIGQLGVVEHRSGEQVLLY